MAINVSQEKFLSNDGNKRRLISMLEVHLRAAGCQTKQAEEDADVLNIKTDIYATSESTTSIIVEDVDLLVLMTQPTHTDKNVLLLKPGKKSTRTMVRGKEFCSCKD